MEARESLCIAVRRIAWGYVLLLVDIHISTINLLPNWLGFLLILWALPVLANEVPAAGLLRPLAALLALWEGACWCAVLVGAEVQWPLAQLLATVVALYLHFQLLTNLAEIASGYGWPRARALQGLRTVQALLLTVTYLLQFFRQDAGLWAIFLLVAQLLVALWICKVLFSFHRFLQAGNGQPS